MLAAQNIMKEDMSLLKAEMKDTMNAKLESFHNDVSEIKAMLATMMS